MRLHVDLTENHEEKGRHEDGENNVRSEGGGGRAEKLLGDHEIIDGVHHVEEDNGDRRKDKSRQPSRPHGVDPVGDAQKGEEKTGKGVGVVLVAVLQCPEKRGVRVRGLGDFCPDFIDRFDPDAVVGMVARDGQVVRSEADILL